MGWLRAYDKSWLRPDLIAGLTLAAYLLPSGIGDASLANLPPQAGLYACLFSGLVFWAFCSSRHTAISVTSAISLLVGTSLGELAGGDAARFAALAAALALLSGAIAAVAWAVRAGSLVNFVSESVLIGFKTGVALHLTSTQLPKLFGFKGSHGGDFWDRMRHFFAHLDETNGTALAVGLVALAVLALGKALWRTIPFGLIVVVGGIVAARTLGLESRGVAMLGDVPQGLPIPGLPAIHWADVNPLLPLAMACFGLGAVETAAIGRMFAAKHGTRFDSNRELLALAAANLAAGFGRGFPVSGGMSQSLVNESAGARTPLSTLIAALLVLAVTIFLTGLLRTLPQPVLAAVVLMAVTGLFKFDELRRLRRAHKSEYAVAAAALLGVLGAGLLHGVLIGAAIALVLLLRRASRPHVAVLGKVPGTERYSDMERHPDNQPVPGVLIVRPEASLLYFNVDHVCETVLRRVRDSATAPRAVVCDLSASAHVDLQAAHALAGLASDLEKQGIEMHVVETRSAVRDMLRSEALSDRLGGIHRLASIAEAVAAADVTRR